MALGQKTLNKDPKDAKDVKAEVKTAAAAVQSEATKTAAKSVATEDIDESIVGSKSDSIAIVGNLGDPSDTDSVPIKTMEGDTEVKSSVKKPRIVGYRLKNVGAEVIKVDLFGLTDNYSKSDRMNHNPVPYEQKDLKPGEEVDLTVFETGVLCARPEFNSAFTGGDRPVSGRYSAKKGSSDTEVNSDETLFFNLTPGHSEESWRMIDLPYFEILTFTFETGQDNKRFIKSRTIKGGFERFAPIANRQSRRGATRASGKPAVRRNVRNEMAQTFLATVQMQATKAAK